ncbi:14-3-3 protein homolog [Ruditapes philippinarum]|uniref:14-3-3 protein homolog n=1 Tax=Ruditapes philippinarum TaxID=129788 RepID=UPI00295ACD62|nr:14-3-3 protein homolog [Ruditapes philippinarum]
MPAKGRDSYVVKAQLSEAAGRYDEMVEDVRDMVTALPKNNCLTEDERNLLAVAFKNEVGVRRRALKSLQKIFSSTKIVNPSRTKEFHDYKANILSELEFLCNDLIWMLDSKLLPAVKEPIDDIFYHKMKADYFRYLAEVEEDEQKSADYIEKAKENYAGATEVSQNGLAATHPLRIGLAMNYSVFMKEMLGITKEARDHAKRFYDEALDELESVREVDESRYSECAYLLKLLHENINVWSLELGDLKTPSKEF